MRALASPVYYGRLVLGASAVSELLAQGATSYVAGLFFFSAAFAIIATRFIGFVYDPMHGYVPAFDTFLAISSFVLVFMLLLGANARRSTHA